ncbi:hypothetical protein [Aeromonas veronii]|uniref:hypothetical protein n=1 Tax=Aeromonas veronii TaxID=654 RepID=UPI0005AB3A0E|nr:hypothetical protein [Aeromonas veronii]MBS4689886.1 hypothetical protein [Aeromonas veronii bv. veronii]OKP39342.1 hypothetical protein BJP23_00345 [Aeromonas veronii bv. veronii]
MTGFYLRDTRTNVGSTCMFWALNGNGYTSNLDKAHVYTLEEAQSHFNDRYTDVPLSKALVDELATVRVDHQYLDDSMAGLKEGCDQYVIHCCIGDFDGNDVYWKAQKGSTVCLSDALILTAEEVRHALWNDEVAFYPLEYVKSISRRTFQARNVNERRMITVAGIRMPKRRRERPTTGRHRGNCPDCGKVTWGLNPYEAYTCAEAAREKYGASHIDDCEDAARYSKARKEAANG